MLVNPPEIVYVMLFTYIKGSGKKKLKKIKILYNLPSLTSTTLK